VFAGSFTCLSDMINYLIRVPSIWKKNAQKTFSLNKINTKEIKQQTTYLYSFFSIDMLINQQGYEGLDMHLRWE
jgi:hypothetical protein